MYTLEKEKLYPLSLPLLHGLKRSKGDYIPQHMKISAYLSKTPAGADTFDTLTSSLSLYADSLRRDQERILALRALASQIRATGDFLLYADAFLFAFGAALDIGGYTPSNIHTIISTTCFTLDLPIEQSENISPLMSKEAFDFARKFVPKTFDHWKDILTSTDISQGDKAQYSHKACLLFEYILRYAEFSFWGCWHPEHRWLMRKQVLSYCKFLFYKGIYLPRSLQEMVAQFAKCTK